MPGERHSWPPDARALRAMQEALAAAAPPPWTRPEGAFLAAGAAVVSGRGGRGVGRGGEVAYAGAALFAIDEGPPREVAAVAVRGAAGAPYEAGALALREGPLLEAAVRALPQRADVVLVHAAGRDHPRRAGLALMLGAVLGMPSAGVTSRPLVATGALPAAAAGARTPLALGGEVVAYLLRTRADARPVVAHAGWRTSADIAAELVLRACGGFRQPEPIRRALEVARAERGRG
jgi:deoxyribonuclease V